MLVHHAAPDTDGSAPIAAAASASAQRMPTRPLVACFLGTAGAPPVLSYRFPEAAAAALGRAAALAQWRARPVGELPELPGFDLDRVRAVVAAEIGDRVVNHRASRAATADLLAAAGIAHDPDLEPDTSRGIVLSNQAVLLAPQF